MARGFESKDVEFQQAEAERRSAPRKEMTAEERELETRRRTVQLALARARADLEAARTEGHKRMLAVAIATLEQQLAAQS
jgi:hypothetical protein